MFSRRFTPKLCELFNSRFSRAYQRNGLFRKYDLKHFSSLVNNYKINSVTFEKYIANLQLEFDSLLRQPHYTSNPRFAELQPVIKIIEEKNQIDTNICNLKELIESKDSELSDLAKEEQAELEEKLEELDVELLKTLVPSNKEDLTTAIVLELQAGVGGQEAMLFAQELFDMYLSFISLKGWQYEIAEQLHTDIGGLRHASILIEGPEVFKYFKYEGGVHRVQRIPATEKAGRIHTSTVTVIALPQPTEIDIQIEPKDLKIETKRSTGAGGQHVNTTDSAVRITHIPTNISVECQEDRSQIKNRKFAMTRLRALLYQRELDKQTAQIIATRKSQVKSSNRNEKIRTYNYNQDRITDHRLHGVHCHNLKRFMKEGQDLENLILQIDRQFKINYLNEMINK
ncbi:hypothetical protein ABEB36_009902 [Hypothenemus hampei]|uniref:Prokaryotic-type class I peptide chain release factors domain-containing protein n=1 Tax=Hypothenemus hampei TaxID=57062 RepID=A0ABD1EHY6_HYPHA